jgi:hypothetical protein
MTTHQIIDACLELVSGLSEAKTIKRRIEIAGSLAGYFSALKGRIPNTPPAGKFLMVCRKSGHRCGHFDTLAEARFAGQSNGCGQCDSPLRIDYDMFVPATETPATGAPQKKGSK